MFVCLFVKYLLISGEVHEHTYSDIIATNVFTIDIYLAGHFQIIEKVLC